MANSWSLMFININNQLTYPSVVFERCFTFVPRQVLYAIYRIGIISLLLLLLPCRSLLRCKVLFEVG